MIREMLQEVETKAGFSLDSQVKSLLQGKETKSYIPLLKRQKCGKCVELIAVVAIVLFKSKIFSLHTFR